MFLLEEMYFNPKTLFQSVGINTKLLKTISNQVLKATDIASKGDFFPVLTKFFDCSTNHYYIFDTFFTWNSTWNTNCIFDKVFAIYRMYKNVEENAIIVPEQKATIIFVKHYIK